MYFQNTLRTNLKTLKCKLCLSNSGPYCKIPEVGRLNSTYADSMRSYRPLHMRGEGTEKKIIPFPGLCQRKGPKKYLYTKQKYAKMYDTLYIKTNILRYTYIKTLLFCLQIKFYATI